MPISEVHNCDCLEYMKTLPDNHFDLVIADPPYGDGLHAEDGGGKGWFTKYNQKAGDSLYNLHEAEKDTTEHRNLRGRFDRYNDAEACSQIRNVERERESQDRNITDSEAPAADLSGTKRHYMFGGRKKESTYLERREKAKELSKKLSRGTLPHRKITSKKCSASHAIKSFGAETTSGFLRPAVS